jgi:sulfite exporter TauE/SafE
MPDTGFLAVFLIGLLGGVHCAGMCGGIVSALSFQNQSIKLVAFSAAQASEPKLWQLHLAYNCGRIFSYTLAGAILGGLGSLGLLLNAVLPVQMGLYLAANLMMIALGIYLIGVTQSLAFTERAGQWLWRRIQPMTRHFVPARRVSQALPLGMLWGWLPCGLVYSVLAMTLLTGSAVRGAATMLAFGLGTLPNLMAAGLLLVKFRKVVQGRALRLSAGSLVMAFGLWGLMNASDLGGRLWAGVVCHL